jgi:hypothetical protein
MKALRRLGFALWLALALVAGQHVALLHDLGHASEKLSQKDSKPAPSKCDQCFACANLAGGAPATVATVPPVACGIESSPFVEQAVVASAPLAYQAQAPPVLL